MAGATPNYGIAFFDFGDELDAPLNVRKEIERFVLIDRQLYGMFNVFGNGVITGWEVTTTPALAVSISPGVGIINSFACETEFQDAVQNLPPNSSGYVYAIINSNTVIDREIEFLFSLTPIIGTTSLLLAKVVTGAATVQTVDNSVRAKIGFKQLIQDEIARHRHNGADAPKLDLTKEVQGELPMDRLADIDSSKIKGGKLPIEVMPTIDHTKLKNVGTLTHAQLDSFAQSITRDNIALFGEVATINLMKMLCYLKYLDDTADKYWVNTLLVIPGVTPDERIDWDNTNAHIDLTTNCISGLPTFPDEFGVGGIGEDDDGNTNLQIITIPWVTDEDWKSAASRSNLSIGNGVKLSVNTVDARIIESFDNGISGQIIDTFESSTEITNTATAEYENPAAQGPLAAKFSNVNTRKMKQVRKFPRAMDWSSYDTLNIYVKSSLATHASVSMSVKNTAGTELATYLLLAADELTTLDNPTTNGFALKSFAISGFTRNDIASIEFQTESITNETESYSVDTIYLTSQEFLLPQGNLRLRYNTTSAVIFNAVEFYGDFPNGSDIRVRVRVANTLEDLAAATYTSLLNSGEVFALPGSYIEIDITFLSDATRKKTPYLTSLYLSLLVPAKESGLTINSAESWKQGVAENVDISDEGVISMKRTNVGNFYFINGLFVNELDPDELPVAGVTADNMPIAPYQGYAAINEDAQIPDEYNPGREFLRGLYRPRSVHRLKSGNFLIADTDNDRIIEMTQEGAFVRGFASHNKKYDDVLYALTANYNPRLGALFITFSRDLDIKFIDLRKIILRVGGRDIQLSNAVDKVRNPTTGEIIDRPELEDFLDGSSGNFQGVTDNVVSIILSTDKQTFLRTAVTDTVTVRIIGNPSPATNAAVPQNQPAGIECFIGDYMYFGRGGVWRPICARETEDDRYVICNSKVNHDSTTLAPTGIGSIIEFEKAIGSAFEGQKLGSTFTSDKLIFSDIMLGSVTYFKVFGEEGEEERKLLVAGLEQVTLPNTSSSSSSSSSSSAGGTPPPTSLGTSEIQKLSKFVGKVIVLDMESDLQSFSYTSPDGLFPSDAYFDDDGNVVIAESSLYAQSGRIVTVDSVGTVINLIDGGMYTKIWDIRKLPDGRIFVST